MNDAALKSYVPMQASGEDEWKFIAEIRALGEQDLFNLDPLLAKAEATGHRGRVALVDISDRLKVSADFEAVAPSALQSLIAKLASKDEAYSTDSELHPYVIDEAEAVTVWAPRGFSPDEAIRLWENVGRAKVSDEAEAATTLKLYGSKLRLTQLLIGACCFALPDGAPILDVMAGTGIVSRKLSNQFEVHANDANRYGALLARVQDVRSNEDLNALVTKLRSAADLNFRALVEKRSAMFERELDFLHGELSETRRGAYAEFCATTVLPSATQPKPTEPYSLCLSRYGNVYFGLAQAAQLDSLRAAIDRVLLEDGPLRDLALAAVITAASTCNSGPHFAQPRNLSSLRGYKQVVERRARNVVWEFELALRNLAIRPPLANRIVNVTELDWQEAVVQFADRIAGRRPAGVYFDPPYSKLQYSRYYHVLNVLLSYDYPEVSGVGRYPPLSQRFSSRFEYRPTSARKEFERAFELCRSLGLTVLVSYSDRGFVPINVLEQLMRNNYTHTTIFSETIRHHSQGVRLASEKATVTEYVLVGRP